MQGKISMDLSFCQSDTGFSLDELATKTGRWARTQGLRRTAEDDFTDGSENLDPSTSSRQERGFQMLRFCHCSGSFTWEHYWLKWKLISPRASSNVERFMRKPGRKIKKLFMGGVARA